MSKNVEIKARVDDLDGLRAKVVSLCDGPAKILDQEDIYFSTPSGRLKLRILGERHGELILYHRDDCAGPKPSNYLIAPTSDPSALRTILGSVLGVLGVVSKQRWLYQVGQTRIHLDRVEGLGEFVELEVVLQPDQTEDEGIGIARGLMGRLGIAEERLVETSYFDLLSKSS
jgi:predicted adenylyl cyclase CyaB